MSKGGSGYQMVPSFSAQNSNTSTTIPNWLTAASQRGVNTAGDILARGTPTYSGEMAPGLTGDQQDAAQMFRNSVGAFQPQFDQAQDYTNASTTGGPMISPETYKNGLAGISSYMNPYISNVVDSVSEMSRYNLDKALNQTADQAIGANAFGGSRHGVQEGVATADNNLNTNNLIANLLNSGYGQATNMLGQDISNNLQAQGANQNAFQNWMARLASAGQQTGANATAARQANVGDITNVQNAGTLEQQTRGAQDQAAYQEFLRQQNYPLLALQAYNQTVGAAPHDTNQNTASSGWQMSPQEQKRSSPLSTALGLGLGAASLYASGGMSGLPGLLGGAYGGLTGQSFLPRGLGIGNG